MPSLLSGSSLRSGGSGQYLPLNQAQPQLPANADTSTGYTVVTDSLLNTTYRNSLGNLEMNSGTVYNNIQNSPIVFIGTGTSNVQIRGTATNVSTNTGVLVVGGGIGIRDGLWTGQDINVNGLRIGQGYQGINNIVITGTAVTSYDSTIGQANIAFGYNTLAGMDSSLRSIAIGRYALSSGTNHTDSIAIGVGALRYAGTNNNPISSTITGVTIIPKTSITGATNATPVLITAINHGLSSGTQVLITGVNGLSTYSGGPSLINNTVFWISRVSSNTFALYKNKTLTTPMNGVISNGYTLTGYSNSGTVFNPVVITSPNYNLIGGTLILITGVNGTTQLNNQSYYVNPLTSSTFALYSDSITNTPVDGSSFTSYISSGSVRIYNANGANIAIGTNAGVNLINGKQNFFLGYNVAKNFITGSNNFIVGHEVASNMTYGNGIFAFGADNLVDGVDNQINIGSVFYYNGGGYLQLNADTGLGLGTSSTGTTSGAFNVYGGAGISDNLYVGTTLNVAQTGTFSTDVQISRNLTVGSQLTAVGNGEIRLSPVGANVYIQPSSGGSVNITSSATGYMDSLIIGLNTPKDGYFDNLYSNNLRVINTITGSINTATNIYGGTRGSIPYQSSTGTTLFIPIGQPDTVLVSNGTTATWKTLAAAQGVTGTAASTVFINTVTPSTTYYLGLDISINDFSKISSVDVLNYDTSNGGILNVPRINITNSSTIAGAAIITTATLASYSYLITSTNSLIVTTSTQSTSTNTGALQVRGGAGIGGNLYVGGILSATTYYGTFAGNVSGSISTASNIAGGSSGQLVYQSNASTTAFVTTGTVGQVLVSNGTSAPAFQSTLTLAGTATSTSTTTGALTVAGGVGIGGSVYVGNIARVQSTASSTSTNTGALVVAGGVGIGGSAYIGNIAKIQSITPSTTTDTGALTVAGGVGIGKNLYVGGPITGNDNGTLTLRTNDVDSIDLTPSISITAGNLNTGGSVLPAGYINITGGNGIGSNNRGGDINITAGWGNKVASGSVNIIGGLATYDATGPQQSGDVNIMGGLGYSTSSGNVYIGSTTARPQGSVLIAAGTPATGKSASLQLLDGVIAVSANQITLVSTATTGTINNMSIGATTAATARFTTATIISNTSSTSTSTGALRVVGGVGIGGNLYIGGTTFVANNIIPTTSTLSLGTLANPFADLYLGPNSLNIDTVRFTGVGSTLTIVTIDGTPANLKIGSINIGSGTNTVSTTTGALVVNGGVGVGGGMFVGGSFTSTGIIYQGVWPVSTASNVLTSPFAGIFTITNTNSSISTNSGALQIAGGMGIGNNLNVGGIVSATNFILNGYQVSTGTGALSTATNIAGGSAGQLHYQSSTGATAFVATGTVGQVLVSNGTGAPVFQNTLTLTGTNLSTNTTTGALQVSGGVGIGGNLYIGNTATITSTVNATSTNSGALQVVGGVGVGGDIYAKNIYMNGALVATGIASFNGGIVSGISTFTNTATSISTASGAVQVYGGVGIGGNLNVGGIVSATTYYGTFAGNVSGSISTATNIAGGSAGQLHYQSSTGATAFVATGTVGQVLVSNGTGAPVFQNTLTLAGTAGSTSTTTGALQVSGGVGIGGNLYVGGNVVTPVGQYVIFGISTSTGAPSGTRITRDGVLNGLDLQTSATSRLFIADADGAVIIRSTAISTSTMTGALVVKGGAGISGSVYVGNSLNIVSTYDGGYNTGTIVSAGGANFAKNVYVGNSGGFQTPFSSLVNSNLIIGIPGLSFSNGPIGSNTGTVGLKVYGVEYIDANLAAVQTVYGTIGLNYITSSTISSVATPTTITNLATVFIDGSTQINTTTNITVQNNWGLYSVGGIRTDGLLYASGNASIAGVTTVTNITSATSTTTGALKVVGGVGIGGNLYVGGIVSATTYYGTFAGVVSGSISTATNIAGGNAGQLVYQSSTGTTAFVATGTVGQVLVSNGTGAPVFQSTLTLAGTATSTSTTTGALTVTGGVGIGGNLNVGGGLTSTNVTAFNIKSYASTSTGAAINLTAGNPTGLTGNGGAISITAGGAGTSTSLTATNGIPGSITLTAGFAGNSNAAGGAINLKAGDAGYYGFTGPSSGGSVNITAGTGAFTGNGGDVNLTAGQGNSIGGNVFVTAGRADNGTTPGAVYITAGDDGSNGRKGGNVYIRGGSGTPGGNIYLQDSPGSTVVFVGNAGTQSTSSTTGALVVTGGVGISGNLNVGGIVSATNFILNGYQVSTSTAISTATNIAGGSAGQLHYQSSTGTTAFVATGTVGQVLVSNGTGAPAFQSTLTLAGTATSTSTTTGALVVAGGVGISGNLNVGGVITATNIFVNGYQVSTSTAISTATNIAGGSAGQLHYQSSTGTTAFVATGTVGQVLVSNGTGAPVFQNTLTLAGTAGSTSTTTGALQVVGGVGVGGNVNIGGTVTGGSIRTTSTSTAPANPTVGDIWYDTATDDIFRYTTDGTTSVWLDITGPTVANSSVLSISTSTMYYRLNSDLVGANATGAQSVFGVGVTLNSNTVYQFEAVYALSRSAGATTHNFGIGFGGVATLNNIGYQLNGQYNGTGFNQNTTAMANLQISFIQTAANTNLITAIASAPSYFMFLVKGTVSVNGGGTFIPQYTLSAAPGGAYTTALGSYFTISPIGTAGSNSIAGPWA